jgi:hypothetical protein
MAEGILELVVQHGGACVEKGLHCRPVPTICCDVRFQGFRTQKSTRLFSCGLISLMQACAVEGGHCATVDHAVIRGLVTARPWCVAGLPLSAEQKSSSKADVEDRPDGVVHMWTALSSQGVLQRFDQISCVHMSGLLVRSHMNAGQDGCRDRGSKHNCDLIEGR